MSIDTCTADLLQSAIHDLKGPASRIRLGAQLLGRSPTLDPDARTLLQHIEDSAAAIDVVAAGLRQYVELCGRPVEREPVDLSMMVESATRSLWSDINQSGAVVTHSTLRVVEADRFMMIWMFQELLANAIRFRSQDAPRVHVSASDHGANWYVAVADNGPGIEPRLAKRVFQPFQKLSAGGGAGLGLTICRKIVEMHGGEIWLEPRDGGAEFRFTLG